MSFCIFLYLQKESGIAFLRYFCSVFGLVSIKDDFC